MTLAFPTKSTLRPRRTRLAGSGTCMTVNCQSRLFSLVLKGLVRWDVAVEQGEPDARFSGILSGVKSQA